MFSTNTSKMMFNLFFGGKGNIFLKNWITVVVGTVTNESSVGF